MFADMRSADAQFATIDYSDEPPLLFVGESLEFEDLRFQKSEADRGLVLMVRTLECPNCGGTVQLKYERTINAVCIQCLSILDATTPALQILQKFEGKQRYQPKIPLGTRGKLPSGQYEAIGFQMRYIYVDGVTYTWSEYLAIQPLQGLSISDRVQRALERYSNASRAAGALAKRTPSRGCLRRQDIHAFQTADATTGFVMGEFPWQVRVGETVQVKDYVCSAGRASRPKNPHGEVVWSAGTYTRGAEIWKAFGLKGSPPPVTGVYANQPSPYQGTSGSAWSVFVLLTLLLLTTMMLVAHRSAQAKSFSAALHFRVGSGRTVVRHSCLHFEGRASRMSR